MTIRCPRCSYDNPDNAALCARCATPLQQIPNAPQSNTYAPPMPPAMPNPVSYGNQGPPPYQQQVMNVPNPNGQGVGINPMGSNPTFSLANSRHAFAGHGIPLVHHSWLLDDDADKAKALFSKVMAILHQRAIFKSLNTNIFSESVGVGILSEKREYIVARRGISTIFLYIAPVGKDLYISRSTYILPRFELTRIVNFILLVLTALLSTFTPDFITNLLLIRMGNNVSYDYFGTATVQPIYLINPSYIPFIVFFIFVISWFFLIRFLVRSSRYSNHEKDFWVYLRARDLKDFQLDDIMLLEHGIDQTVQRAAKELNLDASKITPPAQGYKANHKIEKLI